MCLVWSSASDRGFRTRSTPSARGGRSASTNPFIIYVGRIDANKGCEDLFRHFSEYADRSSQPLDLVLIGTPVLAIPNHPRIRHLGFVADQDKFDAIAAAEALVMPSPYESLSMVALEAWALGRPVLASARCDVLVGQCLRSNAGLYYEDAREFGAALDLILSDRSLAAHARQQRPPFLRAALQLAGDRARVSEHARRTSTDAARAPHGAVARLARAPGEDGAAGRRRRERPAKGSRRHSRRASRPPAGHAPSFSDWRAGEVRVHHAAIWRRRRRRCRARVPPHRGTGLRAPRRGRARPPARAITARGRTITPKERTASGACWCADSASVRCRTTSPLTRCRSACRRVRGRVPRNSSGCACTAHGHRA